MSPFHYNRAVKLPRWGSFLLIRCYMECIKCFCSARPFQIHIYTRLSAGCLPVLEGNARCVIENHGGTVTLRPLPGGVCQLNGREIVEPCRLAQGQFFTQIPQFLPNTVIFDLALISLWLHKNIWICS